MEKLMLCLKKTFLMPSERLKQISGKSDFKFRLTVIIVSVLIEAVIFLIIFESVVQ